MTAAAKPKNVTPDFDPDADPAAIPEDWNWDTVAEAAATKVVFDTFGDSFVGQYKGREEVKQEPTADGANQDFTMHRFLGRDGDTYAVNNSFSLDEGLEDVPIDTWVRLTYVKDVPTGRKLNPMKSFKIDVRR